MNKEIFLFEDELRRAIAPMDARDDFIHDLERRLKQHPLYQTRQPGRRSILRPAWRIALSFLMLLITSILLIGPDRVYAEVMKWLGYIPGIGIVDQSQPIRVLAEPVRVTRDGVTVSVNQAVLTSEDTQIEFGYSGVPLSAYPAENEIGCIEREFLQLADGSIVDRNAPIPADINEATLIIPCIFNTLPDTVPTDWEIPLVFIPLPDDTQVLPLIELTPESTSSPEALTDESANENEPAFEFNDVIETDDGYILIGWFRPHLAEKEHLQVNGTQYLDANGNNIKVDYPQDIDLLQSGMPFGAGDSQWAIQFDAGDIAFPLTIRYSGNIYTALDLADPITYEFDAGSDPQPGQEWILNEDLHIPGITLRLVSIRAGENGYSFQFESDPPLDGLNIQIEGHQAIAGGGGPQSRSLVFEQMPTGKLTLTFSSIYPLKETRTWEGTWQPADLPDLPISQTDSETACLDANSLQTVPLLADGLEGWMLATELNPDVQLVLQSMDGKEVKLTIPQASRGSLSPDGTRLAYPGEDGIMVMDLTGEQTVLLPDSGGYDLHWSPDGKFIASVNPQDGYGIHIAAADGSGSQQLTVLGYESIAGWSLDGKLIYYATPDAGGKGFMLHAVETASGTSHDLFILEDSSRKAPLPAISPDGTWIAYRGSDNNSLYLKGMDGSPARLLLDQPAIAINGIAWEKAGHLLGVSLITPENSDGEIILIQVDNCEIYRIPQLHGELESIFIP